MSVSIVVYLGVLTILGCLSYYFSTSGVDDDEISKLWSLSSSQSLAILNSQELAGADEVPIYPLVRIKVGSKITHDLSVFEWPHCRVPYDLRQKSPNPLQVDPDLTFLAVKLGHDLWSLSAAHFGDTSELSKYGNGPILAKTADLLVVATDSSNWCLVG